MLMDEMNIQKNLVWHKCTGAFNEYFDFRDSESNHATL